MASFTCISNRLYTVLKMFSLFRIFEQLVLGLKHRVCPENLYGIEYTVLFIIQDF